MREKEVRGLMEAYSQVYTPQELTEEQVWEEVESWVNSLIEEGYDLSDYTWEEMYEAYLEEASDLDMGLGRKVLRDRADRAKTTPRSPSPATPQPQLKGLSIGKGGFNINNKPVNTGISPIFQRPGAKPAPAAATPATSPAASRPAAGAPARPAATATAPKPAATVAPKPTSPAKPAPGTKAAGPESIKPKTPNPLMQKTFGYQTGNSPREQQSRADKIVQSGAVKALAPKPSTPPAAATPAPKPTPAATGSKKPGSIVSSVDLFDLVKGHLLDEGYADSEEGAMVIMVNMSEEWKESILESCGVELELDESQHARENPDEYERSSEAREGRRKRSGINDPKTGINSPAFQAFMAKQMGGKKKKD